MSTKRLDLKQLQISVTELLSLIQDDKEIVITEGNTPVAILTVLNPIAQNNLESEKTPQPGLNLEDVLKVVADVSKTLDPPKSSLKRRTLRRLFPPF